MIAYRGWGRCSERKRSTVSMMEPCFFPTLLVMRRGVGVKTFGYDRGFSNSLRHVRVLTSQNGFDPCSSTNAKKSQPQGRENVGKEESMPVIISVGAKVQRRNNCQPSRMGNLQHNCHAICSMTCFARYLQYDLYHVASVLSNP